MNATNNIMAQINSGGAIESLLHDLFVWSETKLLLFFNDMERGFAFLQGFIGRYNQYSINITFTDLIAVFSIAVCLSSFISYVMKKVNQNRVKPTTAIPAAVYGMSVFDLAKTSYEKGHTETVIRVIEEFNQDVNFVLPGNGLTLLLCACIGGKRELCKYLIDRGANVSACTLAGDTALYLATYGVLCSSEPDLRLLDDLVSRGCNVNKKNKAGYTPLHRAASKGNMAVIEFLLKKGASPYICSKSGVYPIDCAINSGHLEAAELMQMRVNNPHVWDIVEPHTPPKVSLGLLSPRRKHLIESPTPRRGAFCLKTDWVKPIAKRS